MYFSFISLGILLKQKKNTDITHYCDISQIMQRCFAQSTANY